MSTDPLAIDADTAIARLMHFLAIEGTTGNEKLIADAVADALIEAGVPKSKVKFDKANQKIELPTQTGNLIAQLPGTRKGPRLLFSTHLDTVPLCAGAKPVRKKDRIVPEGETALGGDNRTGVAVLVTLVKTLLANGLPHPPLTLLFTVREESGLHGARNLDLADLGDVVMGFNVDGREPAELTLGAVGAERWEAEIFGKASHAGVHPDHGISATLITALALAEVHQGGWFGKVTKGDRQGTSNVGSVGGKGDTTAGNATNVVTDYVHLRGEARSHDPKFVKEIVKAYREAFASALDRVTDHKGKRGKLKFTSRLDYSPFRLPDTAPVVKHAEAAAAAAGFSPTLRVANGGLDANWLVKHGLPTVTFGAGQHEIHTVNEFVDLKQYLAGCRMALALATHGG